MLNKRETLVFLFFLPFSYNIDIIINMIKGIDVMNNQNTNGTNDNHLETLNPVPTNDFTSMQKQNNVMETNGDNLGSIQETITDRGVETLEPIKPSLDTILNGNEKEMDSVFKNSSSIFDGPIDETVVDTSNNTITNTVSISDTDSVVNNLNNSSIESSTINEPIIETIDEKPLQPNISISEPAETISIPNTFTVKEPREMQEMDDFKEVPVPPVFEENDKKEKGHKSTYRTLIVVLIFVLVIAIGFGVYLFLTMAKNSATTVSVVTKDVELELGSMLPSDFDTYATVSGYNKNECQLDLGNVDMNKVSTYKYHVTCGKETVEGTIIVDDTTNPEVILNDLVVLPNSTVKAEDFIDRCLDASTCTYELQTDVTLLLGVLGEHSIEILVSDEYNNKTNVTAKLVVSNTAPIRYLTCKKGAETLEDIQSNLIESYRIGVSSTDTFYNAVRLSEFKFANSKDYQNVKNSYDENLGIHNRIGTIHFNEQNQLILIKENKTLEDMNKDLNGILPNNINILKAYLSGLGYICN